MGILGRWLLSGACVDRCNFRCCNGRDRLHWLNRSGFELDEIRTCSTRCGTLKIGRRAAAERKAMEALRDSGPTPINNRWPKHPE
eukprot:3042563-Amphidinium_carterae.1